MAYISLEGEVTRLNSKGNGFGVKESWKFKDYDRVRYWSVFPKDSHNINVGDTVTVQGVLETKVGEPRQGRDGVTRSYVEHTIGSAKVESVANSGWNKPAQSNNGWNTETPF